MKYARKLCHNCIYWQRIANTLREENAKLNWAIIDLNVSLEGPGWGPQAPAPKPAPTRVTPIDKTDNKEEPPWDQ